MDKDEIIEDLDVSVEVLEQAINDMLPGLANHVRDVNLDPKIAELYKPGIILREKAFVDASRRVGGMVTTHRFAILSNHMADFIQFEHDTNWGLCVAQCESHFKVMDVYEYNGKTQITLLHLLDDDRWRLFANAEFDMPGLHIEEIRARFEEKCDAEAIPELTTEQWLDRCSFPVGVSPDGALYSPEPKPAEALWRVADTGFRRLVGNVVFVCKGPDDEGNWLDAIPEDIDGGGIFAYPYIDPAAGLTFRYLCPAAISEDGNQWLIRERDESILGVLRAGALENALWCPTFIDPSEFEPYTTKADENYVPDDPAVLEIRELEFLDPIRHPLFPDDVQALLIKQDANAMELVWLHLCDVRDDTIYGKLLNETDQDLGVHVGDVLPLAFREDEEDGLVAAVLIDQLGK